MALAGEDRFGSKEYELPDGESATCYGIWVLEVFTPSFAGSFSRAMQKRPWDKFDVKYGIGFGNADKFKDLRSHRSSGSWWHLGTVADVDSGASVGSRGTRESLPDGFTSVRLTAIQVGGGTTFVVARFSLDAGSQESITEELRRPHKPYLLKERGKRAKFIPCGNACVRAVRHQRSDLHEAARAWLTKECPGYFAAARCPQPAADLILFRRALPASLADDENFELYEALGMPDLSFMRWVPERYSCLSLTEDSGRLYEPLRDCVSIVGNETDALSSLGDELVGYATRDGWAVASAIDEWVMYLLLMRGAVSFLDEQYRQYGVRRDRAISSHGRFLGRDMRDLKRVLLSDVIDVAEFTRDADELWDDTWASRVGSIPLYFSASGRFTSDDQFDYRDLLRRNASRSKKLLSSVQSTYVDTVASIAELDSARVSLKVARAALLVAIASLVVAALAFFFSDSWPALLSAMPTWL